MSTLEILFNGSALITGLAILALMTFLTIRSITNKENER